MTAINNQQEKIITDEVVYILKTKMTHTIGKILGVSRCLEIDGKVVYSDNITCEMFLRTLDNPDIFRLVELFSMGEISLNVGNHTASRPEHRKYVMDRIRDEAKKQGGAEIKRKMISTTSQGMGTTK